MMKSGHPMCTCSHALPLKLGYLKIDVLLLHHVHVSHLYVHVCRQPRKGQQLARQRMWIDFILHGLNVYRERERERGLIV